MRDQCFFIDFCIYQALIGETSFTSALLKTKLVVCWLLKVKNQEHLKPFLSALSHSWLPRQLRLISRVRLLLWHHDCF